MAGSRENFTDSRPQAAVLILAYAVNAGGGTCPPGSAGVPPAPGRRPAMDDPPKAHRCVRAGKMPALPGGVPPASGPKAHRCVRAGKMPALPRGVPPASGPKAHRCIRAGKMPALPRGVPPASGPKAHRCVQAGGTPALPGGLRRSAGGGAPVGRRPVRSSRSGSVETPLWPCAWSGPGCAILEARCDDSANNSKERHATCWYEYEFQNGRSAGRLIDSGLEPNEARAGTWTTNSCRIRHRRAPLALPREGQGRLPERRSIRARETGRRPQVRPRPRPR